MKTRIYHGVRGIMKLNKPLIITLHIIAYVAGFFMGIAIGAILAMIVG